MAFLDYSGLALFKDKLKKPPRRDKIPLGGFVLAPLSGNSFSRLPPEGLEFK
jgi:hypothetical protein